MAIKKDITVDKGSAYTLTMNRKVAGVLVELANYTAKMQIREKLGGDVLIELDDQDGITLADIEPNITLTISGARTASLNVPKCVYDLFIISPTSVPTKLIEGDLIVKNSVTQL